MDGLHAQLPQEAEGLLRTDVGEVRVRFVEAPGGGRRLDQPVVGRADVLPRDPARMQRGRPLLAPPVVPAERHEGRPARTQQPLERPGDDEVEVGGAQRQPAGGLGDVEVGTRPVGPGGFAHRRHIGDPAVQRLHGAEGDQRGAGAHGVGERLQRHGAQLDARAGGERIDQGAEVALGGQHFGTLRERGGDERGLHRDRTAQRDPLGGHVQQPGEGGTGGGGGGEVVAAHGAVGGGLLHGRAQGVGAAPREESAGGGVQIGRLGREFGPAEWLTSMHVPTLLRPSCPVHGKSAWPTRNSSLSPQITPGAGGPSPSHFPGTAQPSSPHTPASPTAPSGPAPSAYARSRASRKTSAG